MASRTNTPALPTLTGTTDDSSRGSLFARSNLGDVVGTGAATMISANDSTITIRINDQMESFTLNQANDQTLTFTVDGGTGPGTDTNTTYTLSFDSMDNMLTLTPSEGNPQSVDLSSLVSAPGVTEARVNELINAATGIVRSVTINGTNHTPNMSGLVDLGTIEASSSIRGGNGRDPLTGDPDVTGLTIDPATGFQIVESGTSGTYIFQTIPDTPGPVMPGADGTFTTDSGGSALNDPIPPAARLAAERGTTLTSISGTLTGPNNVRVTTTGTVSNNGMTGSITFPESDVNTPTADYSNPGEYTVTVTAMGTNADFTTPQVVDTETETFTRFIPFFLGRGNTNPITSASIRAGTGESNAAWDGGITVPAGDGDTWVATTALAANVNTATNTSVFGARLSVVNVLPNISVASAGGDTLTYRVFRVFGPQTGQVIDNFRNE